MSIADVLLTIEGAKELKEIMDDYVFANRIKSSNSENPIVIDRIIIIPEKNLISFWCIHLRSYITFNLVSFNKAMEDKGNK